jgi:hypothetical protein
MPSGALLFSCLIVCCAAADPPLPPLPKPVTRPATKPAAAIPERVREKLVNGSIRYLVPKDWEPTEKAESGMQAKYSLPDGSSTVSILIMQQAQAVPNNHPKLRQQLVDYCLKMAEQDVKNRGADIVDAPKVEKDDRFLARVRVRLKEGARVQDAVHLYRGVGINLVSVYAAANTDDPAAAKAIHDAGALMLLSVTTGAPDRKN